MKQRETITVIGAGYVGLTTAALFAAVGYKVFCLEINPDRLNAIKKGKSFFYEEGLNPIIEKGLKDGTLIPTNSYKDSIPSSDVIFSCVGTPDKADGSPNLKYIYDSAKLTAKYLTKRTIFVQKSTVPVGTGKAVTNLFNKLGVMVDYASNPEFLRESTAISDSLYPDRIVVGSQSKSASQAVVNLYKQLIKSRAIFIKLSGIKDQKVKTSYITTDLNSAELIKVASNAFLALKISFANSIAKLADKNEADIIEIMNGVGSDHRIGKSFLAAGRGFGGGCFPKDVNGLISAAKGCQVDPVIMKAARLVNDSMTDYIIGKIKQTESTDIADKQITVLGLSFKAGTSDTRRSPGIRLANQLASNGCQVKAYDPEANDEASSQLVNVTLVASMTDAVKQADIVIVATDWFEFINCDLKQMKKMMKGDMLVDATNRLDKDMVKAVGLRYVGIGRR